MNLLLKNKSVLVTGASSGLGLATARLLLDEEAIVYTVSRSPMPQFGVNHHHLVADVTRVELFPEWMNRLPDCLAGVLVNAGGPPAGDALELQPQQWDSAYQQVFRWKPALISALLPRLRAQGGSRILLSESISVKHPIDHLALSNSMRLAVAGYAKTLARELAPEGIGCNVIAPGYHDTAAMQRLFDRKQAETGLPTEAVKNTFVQQIPMRRMGRPDEFSALAVFLLSNLSSYITGQVVGIDGGLSAMPL